MRWSEQAKRVHTHMHENKLLSIYETVQSKQEPYAWSAEISKWKNSVVHSKEHLSMRVTNGGGAL